jgi:hypothetical protein
MGFISFDCQSGVSTVRPGRHAGTGPRLRFDRPSMRGSVHAPLLKGKAHSEGIKPTTEDNPRPGGDIQRENLALKSQHTSYPVMIIFTTEERRGYHQDYHSESVLRRRLIIQKGVRGGNHETRQSVSEFSQGCSPKTRSTKRKVVPNRKVRSWRSPSPLDTSAEQGFGLKDARQSFSRRHAHKLSSFVTPDETRCNRRPQQAGGDLYCWETALPGRPYNRRQSERC